MSLLSNQSAIVGNFQNLNSLVQHTQSINGGGIGEWGSSAPGEVLTWNSLTKVWEPQPITGGTNVSVSPISSDDPYYLTFVKQEVGSVPLHTNTDIYYNPHTQVMTVPMIDSIVTEAVNSNNVTVTNDPTTVATYYPTFVASTAGSNNIRVDGSTYTYNPGTNTLTVANLQGNASSSTDATNASNVGVTDDTVTNTTYYPTFVANNTGNNNIRVDSTALTYNPGTNVFSCTSLNVTNINGAPYPPVQPLRFPIGNTLTVDIVNGDNTIADAQRYSYPFKSISAALAKAVAGENVIVNAGVYNETLTLPNSVSLTGTGTQCVVIQKLNVLVDTTLITVGSNCRLENFTAKLTTSADVQLVGIHFPSGATPETGTSITTKMRNSVWTVDNTGAANPTKDIIGVLSDGVSSTDYTAVNAIQRTSINVISKSVYNNVTKIGKTRGILVSGVNYFSVRDMVVWARGSGTNIIGVETSVAGANCSIKTSTVGGYSDTVGATYADINRFTTNPLTTFSTILLGFTDLLYNRDNGNSFSVVTESSNTTFGCFGNLVNNKTYNLVVGSYDVSQLSTDVNEHFDVLVPQNTIMFVCTLRYSGNIGPATLTFQLWKHNPPNPDVQVYTLALSGVNTILNQNKSVDFAQGEIYYARLDVNGNTTSNGYFVATLGFY